LTLHARLWWDAGLLQVFPFITADLGLPQRPGEKTSSNVPLMWIGYPDGNVLPKHKLMSATRIWAFKPRQPQV